MDESLIQNIGDLYHGNSIIFGGFRLLEGNKGGMDAEDGIDSTES